MEKVKEFFRKTWEKMKKVGVFIDITTFFIYNKYGE